MGGKLWIDINARVGQHPINLFDRVPGVQAARYRQAMANGADRQRGRVHHSQRGIGERGDAFGVQARPQHLVQQLMHLLMGGKRVVSGVALGELTWRPTLLARHSAEPFGC